MASTLGSTVPAAADGVVSEPIIQSAQQSPTPKGDLHRGMATNENLNFLLNRDWIYHSTAVWSTLQERGTIIASIPVHPSASNWPNKEVYKFHNGWVGGFKVRVQPMSTFQYGGSLKMGYLPPNIHPEDFPNLSLELLSTFPTINIDPKNTDYTCFEAEDQRRVLFHTGELDFGNIDSYGGNFILFVMGKLVSSGDAGSTTISLVMEVAGNFEYLQPNPKFIASAAGGVHPLARLEGSAFLEGITCDSRKGSQHLTIQVEKSTTRNLHVGWWGAYGVGGKKTMEFPQVTGLSDRKRRVGNDLLTGSIHFQEDGNFSVQKVEGATNDYYLAPQQVRGVKNIFPPNINEHTLGISLWDPEYNFSGGSVHSNPNFAWTLSKSGQTYLKELPPPITTSFVEDNDMDKIKVRLSNIYIDEQTDNMKGIFTYVKAENVGVVVLNNITGPLATSGGVLNMRRTGESFVLLQDQTTGSIDTQTVEMGRAMRTTENTDNNITWVYNVEQYDEQDAVFLGTVLVVRLWPEGYFTTSGVSASLILPTKGFFYKLKFIETLPSNSPLPTPSRNVISLMKAYSGNSKMRADQLY